MSVQVCKDRLDPLADPGKVHTASGLPGAAWSHDSGIQLADGTCELAVGRARIAQEGLAARSRTTRQRLEAHLTLVATGPGQTQAPGGCRLRAKV